MWAVKTETKMKSITTNTQKWKISQCGMGLSCKLCSQYLSLICKGLLWLCWEQPLFATHCVWLLITPKCPRSCYNSLTSLCPFFRAQDLMISFQTCSLVSDAWDWCRFIPHMQCNNSSILSIEGVIFCSHVHKLHPPCTKNCILLLPKISVWTLKCTFTWWLYI